MSFSEQITDIYVTICFYYNLILLRIHLFLLQTIEYRTSPVRKSSRNILIIGDAIALGYGDTVGHCGLATRLASLIRTSREETNLRMNWNVLTAGKMNSKASDWAPGSPNRLFEETIMRGPFKKADVVIVVLGAHDDLLNSGTQTVNSIERVVESVIRLGKQVVVCSIGNEYKIKTPEHEKVRKVNQELKKKVEGLGSTVEVDMAKVFAMGNDVVRFERDFVTLNGGGYRLLASEMFDPVVMAAKKVEWKHWKGKLEGK